MNWFWMFLNAMEAVCVEKRAEGLLGVAGRRRPTWLPTATPPPPPCPGWLGWAWTPEEKSKINKEELCWKERNNNLPLEGPLLHNGPQPYYLRTNAEGKIILGVGVGGGEGWLLASKHTCSWRRRFVTVSFDKSLPHERCGDEARHQVRLTVAAVQRRVVVPKNKKKKWRLKWADWTRSGPGRIEIQCGGEPIRRTLN